jgi:hypothetical protein
MHRRTSRLTKGSLAVVVAAAVPLALAAPAQAVPVTFSGCTLSALPPEFRQTYTTQNVPYVYYPYSISCVASPGGVSVEVSTETWEQDLLNRPGDVDANGVDNADEDRIGSATSSRSFGAAGGVIPKVDIRGVLPHTDTDSNEEPWHQIRFRVTSGAVTSPWSSYSLSTATRIWW